MLISMLIYCALGSVVSGLAGLPGVGGGIVIVPMLVFAFNWQGILPALLGIVAFSMITVPFGARLAQTLPVPRLRKCFAVLPVAVGAGCSSTFCAHLYLKHRGGIDEESH